MGELGLEIEDKKKQEEIKRSNSFEVKTNENFKELEPVFGEKKDVPVEGEIERSKSFKMNLKNAFACSGICRTNNRFICGTGQMSKGI